MGQGVWDERGEGSGNGRHYNSYIGGKWRLCSSVQQPLPLPCFMEFLLLHLALVVSVREFAESESDKI